MQSLHSHLFLACLMHPLHLLWRSKKNVGLWAGFCTYSPAMVVLSTPKAAEATPSAWLPCSGNSVASPACAGLHTHTHAPTLTADKGAPSAWPPSSGDSAASPAGARLWWLASGPPRVPSPAAPSPLSCPSHTCTSIRLSFTVVSTKAALSTLLYPMHLLQKPGFGGWRVVLRECLRKLALLSLLVPAIAADQRLQQTGVQLRVRT